MTPNKERLTASEVGELLDVDAETIRRWARQGRLRAVVYPSGRKFFLRTDVEEILRAEAAA